MRKNVTIKVEEEVLRWARRKAADEGTSVSRIVGEMLEEKMRMTDEYWKAYERFQRLMQAPPIMHGAKVTRDEIYERRR